MIKNSIQSWDGHSSAEKEEFIKRELELAKKQLSAAPFEQGTGAGSAKVKGDGTVASGEGSVAFGGAYSSTPTTASGEGSFASGAGVTSKAQVAHAEGLQTVAGRTQEEAVAAISTVPVSGSSAEEKAAKLIGYASHAEGHASQALGSSSHAEGYNTKALANATHAEGDTTTAKGEAAHSEGYNTNANGNQSHAEGSSTTASGKQSHAEGNASKAVGDSSHAEGTGTETSNASEHAAGKYNASHKSSSTFGDSGNTLFSVGIGSSNDDRKNAIEIMQNGAIYIYGLGGYDGTNPDTADSLQVLLGQ